MATKELKIFQEYINGKTINQIAKENDCSESEVYNLIEAAKQQP